MSRNAGSRQSDDVPPEGPPNDPLPGPRADPEADRPSLPPAPGEPGAVPAARPPSGPPRLRPAGEPEPVYPARLHGSQAHRAPPSPGSRHEGWQLVQRLGMAAIALVITAFFAAVGVVSFASGQLLQGTMAVLGALLSAWVGLLTLRSRR